MSTHVSFSSSLCNDLLNTMLRCRLQTYNIVCSKQDKRTKGSSVRKMDFDLVYSLP